MTYRRGHTGAEAWYVGDSSLIFPHEQVPALLAAHRKPAVYPNNAFARAGAVCVVNYFADRTIPIATRLETWRRFLPVWHRRHRLAVERREPRFVHENGDLKHVMIVGDEFLFFDFETCFRSRDRVKEIVAREILCYLKSMARTVHDEFDTFLEETVAHYPGRDLLTYTREFAFADPNPLVRFGRKLDLAFRERAQKSSSKYRIAARLDTMLGRG